MQQNLPADIGPYENVCQAAATVAEIYEASRLSPRGTLSAANRDRLLAACEAAGVELGDWDRRIVEWLGGYEPETVAVIVGIILRAAEVKR